MAFGLGLVGGMDQPRHMALETRMKSTARRAVSRLMVLLGSLPDATDTGTDPIPDIA